MITTPTDPAPAAPMSAAGLLDQVRAERAGRDAAEVRIMELALEWAHRHVIAPPEPEPRQVSHLEKQPSGQGSERAVEAFERLGLPEVAWHAGASFATALGLSTAAGDTLLRDALVLSLRLPLVFERVLAGQVPVWRARRIAAAAIGAPREVCTYLDQKTAPVAEKIGLGGLDKLIDAAMLDLYPEEREIAQLEDLDKRFVKLDEKTINHTGIADLFVRGDWADLSAFDATCSDIARLLGRAGEGGQYESFEARRSMALGVLADPARAAAMLADAEATGIASQRTRVFGLVAHLTETNLLNMNPSASDDQQRAWLIDVLHRWVGRDDLKVHVQGIVHCGGCPSCDHDAAHVDHDRYTPSSHDRAVVWARDPVCVFPWCDRPARRCDPSTIGFACSAELRTPPRPPRGVRPRAPRGRRTHLPLQPRKLLVGPPYVQVVVSVAQIQETARMGDEETGVEREDLNVPDRFEMIRSSGTGTLRSLISPVADSLGALDERFMDLRAARRGGFVVLRGEPGAGKSTFLDTVHLFRSGVLTERVSQNDEISERLGALGMTGEARIVVVEGREALLDVSEAALETSMHAINTFVRSEQGANTLVVWPTNTDPLMESLLALGLRLGGKALLGHDGGTIPFDGPAQDSFVQIAERTVAALNDGASLSALGISEERARELAESEVTIGDYLGTIRRELLRNDAKVKKLLQAEQFRLWVVVIAGNDVEGDVAALTRGGFAYADIDRLVNSTGANIVKELKKHPDDLGILGTVLDVKILHLDVFAALAIARQHANEKLRDAMRAENLSVSKDAQADDRMASSEVGLITSGRSLGTRRRGVKPGGNTKTAFEGLARIARTDDGLLNRTIGESLVAAELADSYETEKPLGTELRYDSDLYVMRGGEPIRIEVMWRTTTGRAEIANYVLTKLGNYARAIGLID